MEDIVEDKDPNIKDYSVFKEYEDVFGEMPGFPPSRDIDFSIELMHGATLMSNNPYRMSTLELKELQMQL
jgi:hypothetical protein